MTAASSQSVRDDLCRLAHRGLGTHAFAGHALHLLASAIPADGLCLLMIDPATHLPCGEFVENGLPCSAMIRMTEIELAAQDVNTFAALARTRSHTATLSTATGGDLRRSQRHDELRHPHGWGDELRAALVNDHAAWGGLALNRARDRAAFTPAETAVVAAASEYIAEGLRRAAALDTAAPCDPAPGTGIAVLAADDTVTSADATAGGWLNRLREDDPHSPQPVAVIAVAKQARRIATGQSKPGTIARARVRVNGGPWVVLHASVLGDGPDAPTAVIIEPASVRDLAPLLADAYGLTERERTVTRLVAHGLPTDSIGQQLHISPWTVQDHLKAIFAKVGVGTRGELVARLYFSQNPPDILT